MNMLLYEVVKKLVSLYVFGVEPENTREASNVLYITVPKKSCLTDETGQEMAGEHLAKHVKSVMAQYDTTIRVRYRIRDEEWTQLDVYLSKEAEKGTLKAIEGMLSGYKEV